MQIIELKYYLDLLPECDIFTKNKMVEIFFHDSETKAYHIAKKFADSADESFIIKNAFQDDDTMNHVARFRISRLEDIAFMLYILNEEISGYAIKKIPIIDFYLGMEIEPPNRCYGESKNSIGSKPIFGIDKHLAEEKRIYHKELLRQLYMWFDEEPNYHSLPERMPYKKKIGIMQFNAVENFLNENYAPYKERYEQIEYIKLKTRDPESIVRARQKDNEKFYEMLSRFKKSYNIIYHDLLEHGIANPIWKSEYQVFKLIRKYFGDAVFQYKSDWLGLQSIDVFIPSIRVGIEYQGVQHYKAIEHFGGEEGLKRRKKLDEKKKKLCLDNDVRLIEWKYDEPINEIILKNKIKINK